MEQDTEKTVVVFRYWRGQVIALFPELVEHNSRMVDSYMHIGQHGAADYAGIVQFSRAATPEEYQSLKDELEDGFGYNLEIRQKRPARK